MGTFFKKAWSDMMVLEKESLRGVDMNSFQVKYF